MSSHFLGGRNLIRKNKRKERKKIKRMKGGKGIKEKETDNLLTSKHS